MVKITDKRLIKYYGTDEITEDIVLKRVPFMTIKIDLEKNIYSTSIEDINRIIEAFPNITLGVRLEAEGKKENLNCTGIINYILSKLSKDISMLLICGNLDNMKMSKEIMADFIKLKELNINGYKREGDLKYSSIDTIALSPNLKEMGIYSIEGEFDINDDNIVNHDELTYVLNPKVFNTQIPALKKIRHLDLSPNHIDSIFDFYQFKQRFSNIETLELSPKHKIVRIGSYQNLAYILQKTDMIKTDWRLYGDDILNKLLYDYPTQKLNGIKRFGNIFYNPKKVNTKFKEIQYSKLDDFLQENDFDNTYCMITINDMSELSTVQAFRLRDKLGDCVIKINNHDMPGQLDDFYDLMEYIKISNKMDELIGDISMDLPEEKRAAEIYDRITKNIEYSYLAIWSETYEDVLYKEYVWRSSRNLRDALIKGKCVCAGFAEVIKNAFKRKGLECIVAHGNCDRFVTIDEYENKRKKGKDYKILDFADENTLVVTERNGHAWNICKVNGEYYHLDATWDIGDEFPEYFLKSDKTMFIKMHTSMFGKRPKCKEDYPIDILKELFPNRKEEDKGDDLRKIEIYEENSYRKRSNAFNYKIISMISKIKYDYIYRKRKRETLELPPISTEPIPKKTEDNSATWELSDEQVKQIRDYNKKISEQIEIEAKYSEKRDSHSNGINNDIEIDN